jgi:hypothetical protein
LLCNKKQTLFFLKQPHPMKNRTKLLIAFCLFGFGTAIQAQKAIPAAGGNCTGNNGSVSYTVGQLAYTTSQGTSGTAAQGIQLPYEAMSLGIDDAKGINLVCMVSPNPTSGYVKLTIEDLMFKDLSYHLYGMNSNLLLSKKIDAGEMIIPMENLATATYLLIITQNQKTIKTFKIIKN